MRRWGWIFGGLFLGGMAAVLAFAPAAWLAVAVNSASAGRFLLSEARGTVWEGSAVMVLAGGPDSREASALPGRVHWQLGLDGAGFALQASQACCIQGVLRLRLRPGIGRLRLDLVGAAAPASDVIGQWPAAWLVGLGTPWNTLRPSGNLRLASRGLSVEGVEGRWRVSGQAEILLLDMASRLSPLDTLGSYRLSLQADAAQGDSARLQVSTLRGPLRIEGSGQWVASQLHFRATASADPGAEAALFGLLGIIGDRQGASAIISIG
jgi:general secretion pathway protein N